MEVETWGVGFGKIAGDVCFVCVSRHANAVWQDGALRQKAR